MESLLVVVLIVLILLLLLVVFIPAYLEQLSRRNRSGRDDSLSQYRSLERDIRRYERLLAPYLRARSAAYLDLASPCVERLATLTNQVSTLGQLIGELRCPEVFDYLLPVQHFVIAPDHIGAILTDQRRLKKIAAEIAGANEWAGGIQTALNALAAVPERLTAERVELSRRLAAMETIVNQERTAGIEALDDFTRDATATRRFLEEGERALRPGATLPELDGGALALQSAATALAEAESRASDLQRERAAFDQRLRRVAAELDNMQVANKSGPAAADLPQIRPLLRRAAALLNESAPEHRRRREFNAAGADVSTAAQLINFGKDLAMADRLARALVDRDDGVSLNEAIARLRRDIDDLLGELSREHEQHGALADAALAGRAGQLHTRAETLTRQQDDVIAGLTREAAATRERLTRAWEMGQSILRLADDDPLARRYSRLMTQFDEAQRKPSALEQYRRDVTAFEGVWDQWVARVQATRVRIARLRSGLLGLIDEALTTAEPWNCLAEDLTFIQQRAADFENAQAKFAAVRYRREAESIMAQLEAIDTEIESRFSRLKDRATRLHFLESDVGQIVTLASGEASELPLDNPDRVKWERALRLIDHHTRSAHAAVHYEDASVALLRAADAANKLAL